VPSREGRGRKNPGKLARSKRQQSTSSMLRGSGATFVGKREKGLIFHLCYTFPKKGEKKMVSGFKGSKYKRRGRLGEVCSD